MYFVSHGTKNLRIRPLSLFKFAAFLKTKGTLKNWVGVCHMIPETLYLVRPEICD